MNAKVERASRQGKGSSEWKLHPQIFQIICKILEILKEDLFAYCFTNKIPICIVWETGFIHPGGKWNATTLVSKDYACLSNVLPNNTCAPQSNMLLNQKYDLDKTNVVYASMVPSKAKDHSLWSCRKRIFTSNKQLNEVSGIENFWKILYLLGICRKSFKTYHKSLVEGHLQ